MNTAEQIRILREAASLKDYAKACASQVSEWDPEEQVEAGEIKIYDPISLAPIAEKDLVILSDGKCYSKPSMLQALANVSNLKLPYTQQSLTPEDFEILGYSGAPTFAQWKASAPNTVPFDFAFTVLIGKEAQWKNLFVKALAQLNHKPPMPAYNYKKLLETTEFDNYRAYFVVDFARLSDVNIPRAFLYLEYLKYDTDARAGDVVEIYKLLIESIKPECQGGETQVMQMLKLWPGSAFKALEIIDLNIVEQQIDAIITHITQTFANCVSDVKIRQTLASLVKSTIQDDNLREDIGRQISTQNFDVYQAIAFKWLKNPTVENIPLEEAALDYLGMQISKMSNWEQQTKLLLNQVSLKFKSSAQYFELLTFVTNGLVHNTTDLLELYRVIVASLDRQKLRYRAADYLFNTYTTILVLAFIDNSNHCDNEYMISLINLWPVPESKDKSAADFAEIFNLENYEGSTVKECIQKDVVVPFLFQMMRKAAPSPKALQLAMENAYNFFGIQQVVNPPFIK